ncbi:MAG: sugar-binding protein, partial [Ilumatobacteraceae bacterium]
QRWNDDVNPSPGTFDFASQAQEDDWLAAANAVGIKTLSSFHTAPSWSKTSGDNMANDLLAVYEFGKAAGVYYADTIQAWQIWNEQNRGFSTTQEAADQYASFLKAASIGFQDSGSSAQLTTGGLAGVDPHYADMMYRNEVLDYVDVFAYHTHTTDNYASSIDDHPAFGSQLSYALEHGGDTKGRWVTEAGIALNQGDTATLPDVQQNTAQARYLVTSAIESLAGGTTKQFFFIGAPYREGQTWWSMFRTPTEPMASYAAQAVATDVLGEATYAGALPGLGADVRAHVVQNGSDSVAVLWAPTVRTVTVDLGASSAELTDLMGATSTVTAGGSGFSVEIGPDPVYLSVAGDVPGLTGAPAPVTQAPLISSGEFSTAERVVVQQTWSTTASANSQTNGYALSTTAANPLTVTVVNLNDAAVTVDLGIAVEGGWQLDTASSTVTVAAKSTATVPVSVTAGTEVRQSASELTVTGTVGSAAISPSISDLVPTTPALVTRHIVSGFDDQVRVDYTNTGSTARTVSAVEWDLGAGTVTSTGLPATVAAGATASFTSPAIGLTGAVDYSVRVVFSDATVLSSLGTASVTEATPVDRRTVVVDGSVEVLDSVANVPLVGDGVDPASQTARAAFTWDDDNLYLSAVVEDDVFTQNWTGNATWQGDSIQFAIAPTHPGETMLRPELQVRTEFGLSLTSAGPQLYRYASNGVPGQLVTTAQVAVVHDAASGEIRYEVGVPWSLVAPITPASGVASSLSIAINDNDDGKRRGWVSWGGGITTSKDTELYEPVVFAGSATASISAGTNSRAVCWGDDQVRVAAYAYNNGANPVDVRLRTDFGTKVIAGVQPGKGAYNAFPAGSISIGDSAVAITILDTVTG